MKSRLRYTVCSYLPDPARSTEVYDCAVFAVAEAETALVGINLSVYGIESTNELSRYVIENTLNVIDARIREACKLPSSKSGFDLLNSLVGRNPTSLVFGGIEEVESDIGPAQFAARIFVPLALRCVSELVRPKPLRISAGWL